MIQDLEHRRYGLLLEESRPHLEMKRIPMHFSSGLDIFDRVSLSTISSEALWHSSGRLRNGTSELFRFRDRKDAGYLLSPTHEEEITSLVAATVKSYKETPLKLYQITRKYRDEPRPRQGLLRTREFLMKDLYTFDHSQSSALQSYDSVRTVYARFFDEFKLPYLVAEADSGSMGGNLSHEYHFPSSKGEDRIISCSDCSYVVNEELAQSKGPQSCNSNPPSFSKSNGSPKILDDIEVGLRNSFRNSADYGTRSDLVKDISIWTSITEDKLTLVNVFYPSAHSSGGRTSQHNEVNVHAVKRVVPALDAGIENPMNIWKVHFRPIKSQTDDVESKHSTIINVFDYRLPSDLSASTFSNHTDVPVTAKSPTYFSKQIPTTLVSTSSDTGRPLDLVKIQHDDPCPKCEHGRLRIQQAVELGHTFHLGSRYSEPLQATVAIAPDTPSSKEGQAALQMGCHGIGISRIIGAVADSLADDRGLNWPRVMAPFEAVIIPGRGSEGDAEDVYDRLTCQQGEGVGASSKVGSSTTGGSDGVGHPSRRTCVIDAILDDRGRDFPWKLRDADLIGYPVIVILGRAWKREQKCEVQCRRLGGLKEEVPIHELRNFVLSLLDQL
ncbi:MAG: hypothetical protein M1837_000405 [Sclerophora amabilis]|nr:MAG: hypothetical protein M1837_000405 [Sclerophora amabilis]